MYWFEAIGEMMRIVFVDEQMNLKPENAALSSCMHDAMRCRYGRRHRITLFI